MLGITDEGFDIFDVDGRVDREFGIVRLSTFSTFLRGVRSEREFAGHGFLKVDAQLGFLHLGGFVGGWNAFGFHGGEVAASVSVAHVDQCRVIDVTKKKIRIQRERIVRADDMKGDWPGLAIRRVAVGDALVDLTPVALLYSHFSF